MRRKIFKLSIGLTVLLCLATLAAWLFPNQVLTVDSGAVKADVIVVLGGGWVERSKRAAELFQENAAPRILVTGSGDCEKNLKLLIEAGVPARLIETECESRTTHENAQNTIKLLRQQQIRRVILVTTWYHSRRARACFRHLAPDIEFYCRPSYYGYARAEWPRRGITRFVRAEYPKLLGYWVRYGVCPL